MSLQSNYEVGEILELVINKRDTEDIAHGWMIEILSGPHYDTSGGAMYHVAWLEKKELRNSKWEIQYETDSEWRPMHVDGEIISHGKKGKK
jgi:hypothetical protein